MEERVQTSFIPKTSLSVERVRRPVKNPVALANLVTGVLLFVAVLGATGVYLLQSYTQSQIVSEQNSLAKSREAFEPSTIQELSRLDTRINAGNTLLKQHVSVSKLFDELEKLTLSSVTFSSFKYTESDPSHVVLSMSGQAASYNAVALQGEAFGKSTVITEPIFSNVNVSKDNSISFEFTGIVNLANVRYGTGTPSNSAASTSPQGTQPNTP